MAERYIVKMTGRFPPTLDIQLGELLVPFRRAWLGDGRRCMVACLDDSDPQAAAALRAAARIPKAYRTPQRVPDILSYDEPPTPSQEAAPADSELPEPIAAALANGWLASDLAGAGEGEKWDESGGRSPVTGLCMAEMALCIPPAEWDRETQHPWDVLGWRGPGADWKPPGVASKVADEKRPEPTEEEPSADTDTDTDTDADADADGDGHANDGEADADAALLAEYGDSVTVDQAVAVIAELVLTSGTPSRRKVNYHLNQKHKLPKPTEDQFEALLRALPS